MTAGSWFVVWLVLVSACKDDKPTRPPSAPPPAAAAAPGSAAGAGSNDACQVYLAKARPVIVEMTSKAGQKFGPEEEAIFVRECRESKAKEPLFHCVVAAVDDTAVRACYGQTPPAK